MNLDRFDGYPDHGEQRAPALSVFEKWKLLGYDLDTGDGSLCSETICNEDK